MKDHEPHWLNCFIFLLFIFTGTGKNWLTNKGLGNASLGNCSARSAKARKQSSIKLWNAALGEQWTELITPAALLELEMEWRKTRALSSEQNKEPNKHRAICSFRFFAHYRAFRSGSQLLPRERNQGRCCVIKDSQFPGASLCRNRLCAFSDNCVCSAHIREYSQTERGRDTQDKRKKRSNYLLGNTNLRRSIWMSSCVAAAVYQ